MQGMYVKIIEAQQAILCNSYNNAHPDDGVTAPKHVGAVLMSILM
jgi:hypothetical protein